MKQNLARLLIFGFALASGAGCGTIRNVAPQVLVIPEEPKMKIYGGTQRQIGAPVKLLTGVHNSDDDWMFAHGLKGALLTTIDLPLSILADTITLPITVSVTLYRKYFPPKPSPQANSSAVVEPSSEDAPRGQDQ